MGMELVDVRTSSLGVDKRIIPVNVKTTTNPYNSCHKKLFLLQRLVNLHNTSPENMFKKILKL